MKGALTGIILLALIAMQLLIRTSPEATAPTRLLSGDELSLVDGGWLEPLVTQRCVPVYFASPTCPACARLASFWKGVAKKPEGVWIFEGDPERVGNFTAEYEIPPEQVILIGGSRGEGHNLMQLGLYATPTSAILDSRGHFQHVRVGPGLVDSMQLGRYCPEVQTQSSGRPEG